MLRRMWTNIDFGNAKWYIKLLWYINVAVSYKVKAKYDHTTGFSTHIQILILGCDSGSGKNLPAMQRFNPSVGKIPGEENGNPLKYSCLENPVDRRAW